MIKTIAVFRITLSLIIFCLVHSINAQENQKITTIDFVQVLNDNVEETQFYYENNWKVLREKAIEANYIDSFELLKTEPTPDAPFQFMLVTTYKNKAQYDLRETNFGKIIEESGETKYLNEKKKAEFRKILFNKEGVKHLK
jgi:hypothetical protein